MTTGYWVAGSTTNRTKVHFEHLGKPHCGVALRSRTTYQVCANGVNLSVLECARCRQLVGNAAQQARFQGVNDGLRPGEQRNRKVRGARRQRA